MNKVVSFLERVYQSALVGLIMFLPVIFIPVPWATLPHAKVGLIITLVSISIVTFVLARFFEKTLSFPKSFVVFTSALLPLAYMVSALATGSFRHSLVGAGVDAHTVVMMFFWAVTVVLAALVFRGRVQLVRIQYAFLLGALLVIVFQLTRLFFGSGVLSFGGVFTGPATSVIGSWHDLGIFLGLAAFFAASLLSLPSRATGTIVEWGTWTAYGLSVFLLMVINTYDVWVALAALSLTAIIHYLVTWLRSLQAERTLTALFKNSYVFIILGLFACTFIFFGVTIHDALPDRIRVDSVEVRPSWIGTIEVASQTLEGKQALFGSGPNTFVRQWGLYKPSGVNETAFWNADFSQGIGFIPTSIVTVGFLGALVWILFLMSVAYENVRVLLKSTPDTRRFILPLVAGVVYLWVLAIVYPPGIAIITLAFLFTGALVGWGIHTGTITSYTRLVSDVPRIGFVWSVFLIVVMLISLIVAGLVLRTLASDMLVNKGISVYNTTGDTASARGFIGRALVVDSGNDRAHRSAIELGIIEIAALANSANPIDEQVRTQLVEVISSAIQHGLTAVSQDRGNYQNWLSLARIYEQLVGARVDGAYENAEKSYQQAIAENPTHPFFYLRLAQLAVAKNDMEATQTYLEQALALKPNYAEALFILAQVRALQGDVEGAILAAHAATQAAPQEPVAWFQLGTLLYQTEKHTAAAEALRQAVLLNGNYANALYVLGLTYVALNQTTEAKAIFTRVLELNPGNAQIEQLLTALEKSTSATDITEEIR